MYISKRTWGDHPEVPASPAAERGPGERGRAPQLEKPNIDFEIICDYHYYYYYYYCYYYVYVCICVCMCIYIYIYEAILI